MLSSDFPSTWSTQLGHVYRGRDMWYYKDMDSNQRRSVVPLSLVRCGFIQNGTSFLLIFPAVLLNNLLRSAANSGAKVPAKMSEEQEKPSWPLISARRTGWLGRCRRTTQCEGRGNLPIPLYSRRAVCLALLAGHLQELLCNLA